MRILTFTSIFPNSVRRELGVFIYQRTAAVARLPGTSVDVVAPIPYFPHWLKSKRWGAYSQIPLEERVGNLHVSYPRYLLLPGIAMPFHGLLMFLGAVGTVRRLHRIAPFDCIEAHYVYPDGFAAVLLGKLLNVPVVVSARGTDINLFPSFRLIRPLIKWTLRNASGLIAVSAALKGRQVELGVAEDKIRVISNGADTGRFRPDDRRKARSSLGLPVEGFILVSVGSLVPVKRHELLIRAVAKLSKALPELNAFIIGDGPLRQKLESLIQELHTQKCIFLQGARPHDELPLWFNAANASCLLSSREGHPNVVVESLACGTPVVGTRAGGIPEILTRPELGILVEGNEQSVLEGLKSAVRHEWDREAIARHVQSRTWGQVAAEVSEALNQAVLRFAGKPESSSKS